MTNYHSQTPNYNSQPQQTLPYRAEFPYTDSIFTRHINKPIKTILELGCNKFQYTYNMIQVYNPDVLYAFEACPKTAEFCKANVKDERIKFVPQAVSDYDGTIDFYRFGFGEDTTCASVFERIHRKEEQEPPITVPCTRIDTFFKDTPNISIDLVCMDIQGAELMALRGLGKLLENVSFIMMEIPKSGMMLHKNAPTTEDFFKFFHENKFQVIDGIWENHWEDNILLKKA